MWTGDITAVINLSVERQKWFDTNNLLKSLILMSTVNDLSAL